MKNFLKSAFLKRFLTTPSTLFLAGTLKNLRKSNNSEIYYNLVLYSFLKIKIVKFRSMLQNSNHRSSVEDHKDAKIEEVINSSNFTQSPTSTLNRGTGNNSSLHGKLSANFFHQIFYTIKDCLTSLI